MRPFAFSGRLLGGRPLLFDQLKKRLAADAQALALFEVADHRYRPARPKSPTQMTLRRAVDRAARLAFAIPSAIEPTGPLIGPREDAHGRRERRQHRRFAPDGQAAPAQG